MSGTPKVMGCAFAMPVVCGALLRTSCVPFVMLVMVVPGEMFAPNTACPTARPAVLGSVTVVEVVAAVVLSVTPSFTWFVAVPTPPVKSTVPPAPSVSVLKFSTLLPPAPGTELMTFCPMLIVSEPAWPAVPSVVAPPLRPKTVRVPPLNVSG